MLFPPPPPQLCDSFENQEPIITMQKDWQSLEWLENGVGVSRPQSQKCHDLICFFFLVPWKTPLTRLSLCNLTQSCPVGTAFPLELLVENSQRQLINTEAAYISGQSCSKAGDSDFHGSHIMLLNCQFLTNIYETWKEEIMTHTQKSRQNKASQ